MRRNFLSLIAAASIASMAVLLSCQGGGNAPGQSASEAPPVPVAPVPPSNGNAAYALVYGSTAGDRSALSDRIAGYQAPGLSVVFSQWRRFAGGSIFNTTADLVPRTPAQCFTSFDSNYNWVTGVSGGVTTVPGTNGACVSSDVFVSTSWNYIPSPDRIYNAANGTNFNGFLSALKFDTYTLQATLTSADRDDDAMGLIIAAVVDGSNNVHTLTALRSQGGLPGNTGVGMSQGWAIIYRINTTVVSGGVFGERSVGGINPTGGGSGGDGNGWNGRKSLVRVERTGDSIKVSASNWVTGSTTPVLSPASEINLDLASASIDLSIFQGVQYYGYGTISQLGATFSDIVFTTPNAAADPTFLYDLLNNIIYYKDNSAGYSLLNGYQAYNTITGGTYPLRFINNETQKEFRIDSASGYTEL